ncbi:MAG: hypothetical protein Q8N98_04285 [bacterium]|nr:hypothetical protein [bacterium]
MNKTIKIILSFVSLFVISPSLVFLSVQAALPSLSSVLSSSDPYVSTSDLEILDNGTMFAVVSPFLYQSEDKGTTWTKSANVPVWGPVNDLASKGNTLYLATFRGVYETKDNGSSFTRLYFPPGSASCVEMYVSPKETLFAACPYLVKSEDEGLTWQEAKTYPYPNLYLNHLSFPSSDEILALSSVDLNHLYYSSDSGKLWQNVIPQFYPPDIRSYLTDPKDITHIFLGTGYGMYEIRNAATATASFSLITSLVPVSYEYASPYAWQIPALGLLPSKEASFSSYLLVAIFGKGLYYSTDSAKTFSPSFFIGQSGHTISKIFSIRNSPKTYLSLSDSSPPGPGLFSLIVPPRYNPVVFIHGLGGKPEDWENEKENRGYKQMLVSQGYDSSQISLYSYYDYNHDGKYDYQGDVDGISLGLPSLVKNLSEVHKDNGGDGKVDIVGFSLGGLVARSYFGNSAFDNKVGRFIDLATPHQGTYWGKIVDEWKNKVPFGGNALKTATLRGISSFKNSLMNDGYQQPLDFVNAPAVKQVWPESEFLTQINKPEKFPSGIETNLLYGDITANICIKLFHMNFCKTMNVGDMIMSTESASTVPGATPKLTAFKESINVNLRPVKKTNDKGEIYYEYEAKFPSPSEIKYWHLSIMQQDEVRNKIKELLENE